MKSKYRVITRWKVSNVHRGDLAARLNKLTESGWDIHDVMSSYGRYTVVAKRRVRVKT